MRGLLPAIMAVMALTLPPARAETPDGDRIFVEFAYDASAPELAAAGKWGRTHFARAKAAGRPIRLSVARSRGTTLISLESVAVCDRVKACPLLVFRDLTTRPILETTAFQNVLIEYRGQDIFLVIRLWENVSECRITGMGRTKCRSVPGKSG